MTLFSHPTRSFLCFSRLARSTKMQLLISVALLLILQCVVPIYSKSAHDRKKNSIEESDFGEPVFLTKYIESGDIGKAREKSRTGSLPDAPELLSYSGFFTVNKKYNSNIFFWFFPALVSSFYHYCLIVQVYISNKQKSSTNYLFLFQSFIISFTYLIFK